MSVSTNLSRCEDASTAGKTTLKIRRRRICTAPDAPHAQPSQSRPQVVVPVQTMSHSKIGAARRTIDPAEWRASVLAKPARSAEPTSENAAAIETTSVVAADLWAEALPLAQIPPPPIVVQRRPTIAPQC